MDDLLESVSPLDELLEHVPPAGRGRDGADCIDQADRIGRNFEYACIDTFDPDTGNLPPVKSIVVIGREQDVSTLQSEGFDQDAGMAAGADEDNRNVGRRIVACTLPAHGITPSTPG